jgi:hypothetical protein
VSDDPSTSVVRLIRASAIACAIATAAVIYLSNEPRISTLSNRLEETNAVLRSDDIVLANIVRERARRDLLLRRYAPTLRRGVEATFVRDLDANARRHGADVISTSAERDSSGGSAADGATGTRRIDLTIELRGSYRNLLSTIANLSDGNQIVDVRSISLRRADTNLIARVPISLFEAAEVR